MPIINENFLVNENNDSSTNNKKQSKYQENNYGVIIDKWINDKGDLCLI